MYSRRQELSRGKGVRESIYGWIDRSIYLWLHVKQVLIKALQIKKNPVNLNCGSPRQYIYLKMSINFFSFCIKMIEIVYVPLSKELFLLFKKTDTPKICLKNMQTAFVSYVFSC